VAGSPARSASAALVSSVRADEYGQRISRHRSQRPLDLGGRQVEGIRATDSSADWRQRGRPAERDDDGVVPAAQPVQHAQPGQGGGLAYRLAEQGKALDRARERRRSELIALEQPALPSLGGRLGIW
jgi:hypothetical protein